MCFSPFLEVCPMFVAVLLSRLSAPVSSFSMLLFCLFSLC